MKCIHCGYCCIMLDVIIVHPKYIEVIKSIEELCDEHMVMHKEYNQKCPHLYLQDQEWKCKIHDYPWFKDTPCARHSQIEESIESICRTGKYRKDKNLTFSEELYGC